MIVEQKAVLVYSVLGMDAALNPGFALASGLASMGNEVVFIHLSDDGADGELLHLKDGLQALRLPVARSEKSILPWKKRAAHPKVMEALNSPADLVFSIHCSIEKPSPEVPMIGLWSAATLPRGRRMKALSAYDLCLSTEVEGLSAIAERHSKVQHTAPFFLPRNCSPWEAQRFRLAQAFVLVESEALSHRELDALQRLGLLRLSVFDMHQATDELDFHRRLEESDLVIDLRSGPGAEWLQLHALHSGRHCIFMRNLLDAPVTTPPDVNRLPELVKDIVPRLSVLNDPSEQAKLRDFAANFSVEEWVDRLPAL